MTGDPVASNIHELRGDQSMLYKFSCIIFLCFVVTPPSFGQAKAEYHFDFGPSGSPVEEGFAGVSSSATYSTARGYGWAGMQPLDYTAPKPPIRRRTWYHFDPHYFYDDMVTDLRRDGVESEKPVAFRIDLPPGRYSVLATVGSLNEARYSIDIYANGAQMARGIDARHWLSSERGKLHKAAGYYKRVVFPVEVQNETQGLKLEFKGDDAEYRRLLEIELAKSPDEWPKSRFRHDPLPEEYRPHYDIGGPFTKISLMGLEVYPESALPLRIEPGSLRLVRSDASSPNAPLDRAMELFNRGEFKKAEDEFQRLSDPLSKAMGFLALAGRADYENEYANARTAVSFLQQAVDSQMGKPVVRELLEDARIFVAALEHYRQRGVPPNNGLRSMWRAVAELDQIHPASSLYYKSLALQARYMIILDPHQWAWHAQEGKRRLRAVEEKFPHNRFVQFYLHGNLTDWPDWQTNDYLARVRGAPRWAAGVYAYFNLTIDFAEWWAQNKQQEDGSIGGGWGDDVEVVGVFGYIGRMSEGASPIAIESARKLVRGVYDHSGSMDKVGGFFYSAGDSEHTAEWTGKTLPMVLAVDFGNPIWNERALQSAKLMKEIWMGVNRKNHLHWRSNFLGASGIGPPGSHLDSSINWRAAEPALQLLYFTHNPTIRDLVLQHAEALYEDAMRTDKGKPKGIIPGEVDFETDELGGRGVPTWFDPGDIPARRMYGFEKFHGHRLAVMQVAFQLTGDERFLEPIKIEADYVRRHGPNQGKGDLWKLEPGSEKWIAAVMSMAPDVWAGIEREMARKKGRDIRTMSSSRIADLTFPNVSQIRRHWPYITTDIQSTDRVHVPNLVQFIEVMTGGNPTDWAGHLTYRHVGREFAAAVLGADRTSLTALVHLLDSEGLKTKTIGLVPWKLDLGARYKVEWGPDNDGDDQMDRVAGETEWQLKERGQSVDLQLETDQTYLVVISQIGAGTEQALLADLAISPQDLEYNDDWGYLYVTVHNIGSATAGEYEVLLRDKESGKESRAVGSSLDAPLDLTPKTTRFGFPWRPTESAHEFEVEVKSRTGQAELTSRNNKIETTLRFGEIPKDTK